MERHNKDWSREEHILAFNLYCKIPFGSIHMNNPRIIELARILGRKVGSVSLKLSNFARLDPALQARGIRGMSHGAKGEKEIWHEFAEHPETLAFESDGYSQNGSANPSSKWQTWTPTICPKPGLNVKPLFAFA
jgi:putative restriction endonuclease